MYPVQRETPRAESVLRKVLCQDIPELTVCCVKASSGTVMSNRGGTVEFMLHPQCEGIVDGAFSFNSKFAIQQRYGAPCLFEKQKPL